MRKALLIAAAVVVAASSCSSETGIRTTLDEYSITLSESTVAAGPQTFSVTDRGQIAHQFIVLRTNRAADDLPVAKDGIVKLGAKGIDQVAEIEILSPGDRQPLEVDLRPGRYALICNIAGHYASGMHTDLTAR